MGIPSAQLAQVSLIGQIGGGVTSTIGSYFSAATQKATLRGQAAIADSNARIAELGAQSVMEQGQRKVGALTLKAGQLKSRQRTAMAANGVDLGTGTAADIQASTDLMKEVDTNTILADSVREAWGYRTQSANFANEALTKRLTAGAINPLAMAGGTLLGNAGSVAGSWYALNKIRALDGTPFELRK